MMGVVEQTLTDETALVQRARDGDVKSFSALVEIYQERAVSAAYSYLGNFEDARDLAQDAFVKAYQNLSGFKGESRFYTWFYRILVNLCKDFLRKRKVRSLLSFFTDDLERVPSGARCADEVMIREELSQKIVKAMEALPFRQKSVCLLRYLEEWSLAEIADCLKLSEGAVKAHLWQGGQKMKKSLGAYWRGGD